VARPDDTVEAIERRLALYEAETRPVLEWYQDRHLLVRIDGEGDPDKVLARVLTGLEERLSPAPSAR
jgi:adenylate kinase